MVLVAVDATIVAVRTGGFTDLSGLTVQERETQGTSLNRRSRYRVMVENIPEGTSWQVRVLFRVYTLSPYLFRLVRMRSGLSLSLFPPGSLLSCGLAMFFLGFHMVLSLLESKSSSLSLSLGALAGTLGSQGFDAQSR